ncbi:MAG: hemerythrin [Spirochaetes bacterium GWD1_27_9]|nr:MAG: hemerythrin [Spirochaetes bacterium GWB1_27_13]OHD24912.1 MAG: hemerythrin [Spirochaetes bacterium GWC1_27_15]OHD31808.1 MAG: hemerythrin [Spirochaetes bacterium GWD1_27_9]
MAYINWSDTLSVGVKEFDNQHKKLVDMVNQLHSAMMEGKGKHVLMDVFVKLVNYTVEHFAAEEKLMQKYDYPDYQKHLKEHKDLTAQALELKKKFETTNAIMSIEVIMFLKDWLANHILKSDKIYGNFLNTKGIQ